MKQIQNNRLLNRFSGYFNTKKPPFNKIITEDGLQDLPSSLVIENALKFTNETSLTIEHNTGIPRVYTVYQDNGVPVIPTIVDDGNTALIDFEGDTYSGTVIYYTKFK